MNKKMNQWKDSLSELLDDERRKIYTPGPFFTERVMARWDARKGREFGIWDMVPSSARPVFGMALLLIVLFLAIEIFVPHQPARGMVEAYLEGEQNPAESFLYSEAEVPAGGELLEQMIALEEQK